MNKKLVGSAVVGAAILAIAVAQFWRGEEAPAATPPPPPSVTQGTLEIYRLSDVADGAGSAIEIPVPSTWPVTRDKDRASFRQGDVLLETDRVPITQEDALSGLQALAGRQGGTVVEHSPIADRDAAEWDFTYERDGVPRRVTVVGLGAGDALVTVRFEAPVAEFERNRGAIDEALKISAPG